LTAAQPGTPGMRQHQGVQTDRGGVRLGQGRAADFARTPGPRPAPRRLGGSPWRWRRTTRADCQHCGGGRLNGQGNGWRARGSPEHPSPKRRDLTETAAPGPKPAASASVLPQPARGTKPTGNSNLALIELKIDVIAFNIEINSGKICRKFYHTRPLTVTYRRSYRAFHLVTILTALVICRLIGDAQSLWYVAIEPRATPTQFWENAYVWKSSWTARRNCGIDC
jgi:hypothetical protein